MRNPTSAGRDAVGYHEFIRDSEIKGELSAKEMQTF